MSRSGYDEDGDIDHWQLIMWRGAVKSSLRGKRGQAFLREMIAALDAMPDKRLIPDEMQDSDGEVCALGSVALKRGLDNSKLDPENHDQLSEVFNIARPMVQEIEWENDSARRQSPEERWRRMRAWAEGNILTEVPPVPMRCT